MTVFQAEAFKASDKYQINYKLVRQSLIKVAERNRVQLTWVAGHRGIKENEAANQTARTGSEHPCVGSETASHQELARELSGAE